MCMYLYMHMEVRRGCQMPWSCELPDMVAENQTQVLCKISKHT